MLQEASFDMTQAAYQLESDADKRLLVRFNMHPHYNSEKSSTEGRPIYDEREYVMIMVPGDKDSIVHRPVWDKDRQRFSRQYQAFKSNQSQETASGTPLSAITFISRAQAKELEHFNCHTVEQLANIPDTHAQKFMGINKLKQLAAEFLRAAKEAAPLTAMRAELDQRDATLAAAQAQIADLAARLQELETKKSK